MAAGAQTRVLISQLAGLGVVLVAAPWLGHLMGVKGYAIAAVLSAASVWLTSHIFAARQGAQPPPLLLAQRPVGLAAVILAAWQTVWPEASWAPWAGSALFALAAPLLDPRLIPDFILLAGSKLSPQGATEPPVAT